MDLKCAVPFAYSVLPPFCAKYSVLLNNSLIPAKGFYFTLLKRVPGHRHEHMFVIPTIQKAPYGAFSMLMGVLFLLIINVVKQDIRFDKVSASIAFVNIYDHSTTAAVLIYIMTAAVFTDAIIVVCLAYFPSQQYQSENDKHND